MSRMRPLFSICLPFEVNSLKNKRIPTSDFLKNPPLDPRSSRGYPRPQRIIPELHTGRVLYVDEHRAYVGKR